jgi:hypothetical protein
MRLVFFDRIYPIYDIPSETWEKGNSIYENHNNNGGNFVFKVKIINYNVLYNINATSCRI